MEVASIYKSKFNKFDKKFAADVGGEGSSDMVGSFEVAQICFYRGQDIPLCTEWLREINEDFKKIIYILA